MDLWITASCRAVWYSNMLISAITRIKSFCTMYHCLRSRVRRSRLSVPPEPEKQPLPIWSTVFMIFRKVRSVTMRSILERSKKTIWEDRLALFCRIHICLRER
jgi:MsbA_rel: ABC transporter, permease/ATP-binding protein